MTQIYLKNVRLSFPSLFQTETFGGEDTGKYGATLILDVTEHAPAIRQTNEAFGEIAKEKFKGKIPPDDKLCLKVGDNTDRPELQGKYTIKASTKKRPLVINRDKTPIAEADNVIYAGCYVNAIITLWAQDNAYGRRINAQLDGIQFWRNGDPFGSAGVAPDEFSVFGDPPEDDGMPF
jgi:hypothetical protein